MISVRLAWRMLLRDARAGELTVLGIALLLAVAALTSVSFLADRVERGIRLESHQLLGGDLLLSADHPWADNWRDEARQRGLSTAESATFPSMVAAGDTVQLADIKVVSANYPLRGKLRIAPGLNQPDAVVDGVPPAGHVWLDERLAAALQLAPGASLKVGTRAVVVDAILTLEPEKGFNVFSLAPRLLLNQQDLAATGLVREGSRVSYRLYLAGPAEAVGAFKRWATPRLGRGQRLDSLDNARPELRSVLDRTQRFLRLAALLSVVLAAVAVSYAARRYLRRHLDGAAVMRCLGASGGQLLRIHGGEFLLLGLGVALAGSLLGAAAQAGLHALLAGLVGADLPPAGIAPWLQGVAVSMTLVAGFVLPTLLGVRQVSTLRVLRREWSGVEPVSAVVGVFGLLAMAALMRWIAGEWRLWAFVMGGFLVLVMFYAGIAWLLLTLLGKLTRRQGGLGYRQGLANLLRRRGSSVIQATALGVGLTAMLLLGAAGELTEAWRASVPPDAPDRFVINIQPDQRDGVAALFAQQGLPTPRLEPMVRGRLVAVNGQPIGPEIYPEERARRLVDREFNLSWRDDLPSGNRVAAGAWHMGDAAPGGEFSVEQGLAETLGLKLGDRLSYDLAGVAVTAPITSLRTLEWDSMRVNFFVIASPGLLDGAAHSDITAFRLPSGQEGFIATLVARFPNLTVIDVGSVVRQLQDTLGQVTRAVRAVFGFALLAGLAVLYAALQSGADERRREIALMRALGAQGAQLRAALVAEFALLGGVAGLLASLGAASIATALARGVFNLPYVPSSWVFAGGLGGGLVLVVVAGLLGVQPVLWSSPLQALRAAD